MIYYKQTKAVSWLPHTTEGTVWVSTFDDYIQPEDETLRLTPLGVDLSLLDDSSLSLFVPMSTISIVPETKQLNIASVVWRSEPFYCVSSDALVYGKPCEKWCGDPNCKTLTKQ